MEKPFGRFSFLSFLYANLSLFFSSQSQIPKCGSCPISHLCAYEDKTATLIKKEVFKLKTSPSSIKKENTKDA
jgi:hypothetical protein